MMAEASPRTVHERKPPTVIEAQKEVQKYQQAEADLVDELEALHAKIREENDGLGDKILAARLEGNDDDEATRENAMLLLKADNLMRALRSATRAKQNAEAGVLRAKAAAVRGEASKLQEEVRERMQITNKLLAQLKEHECARFMAEIPINQAGTGPALNTPATKSQEIAMQAYALEEEAKRYEDEAARVEKRAMD
jgi:hypothetical protein